MERILSQRKLQRITSPPDFAHDTALLSRRVISLEVSQRHLWQEGLHWQLQNWVVCCGKTFFSKQPTKVTTTHTQRQRYVFIQMISCEEDKVVCVPSGSHCYKCCCCAVLSRLNHIIENWPWQLLTVCHHKLGHFIFQQQGQSRKHLGHRFGTRNNI